MLWREKLLLLIWAVPLLPGFVLGVRNYNGGENVGLLFSSVVMLMAWVGGGISMVRHARRRRPARATIEGHVHHEGDYIQGQLLYRGHGYIDTPRERGRRFVILESLSLFFLIPAALYLLITNGDWTILVIAVQFAAMLSMGAYFNERDTENDPAK